MPTMKLSPLFPREHGAWGIMGGSFLSTMLLGDGFDPPAVLLLPAFILLYAARYALLQAARSRRGRGKAAAWSFIYGAPGLSVLFYATVRTGQPRLAGWLLLLLPFLMSELLLNRMRMQQHILNHLLGTTALTLISPLSVLYSTWGSAGIALGAWMLNLSFFTGLILFVRFEIARGAATGGRAAYRYLSMCYSAAVFLAATGAGMFVEGLSGLALVFAPSTLQIVLYTARSKRVGSIRTLGWLQIVQTALFAALAGTLL